MTINRRDLLKLFLVAAQAFMSNAFAKKRHGHKPQPHKSPTDTTFLPVKIIPNPASVGFYNYPKDQGIGKGTVLSLRIDNTTGHRYFHFTRQNNESWTKEELLGPLYPQAQIPVPSTPAQHTTNKKAKPAPTLTDAQINLIAYFYNVAAPHYLLTDEMDKGIAFRAKILSLTYLDCVLASGSANAKPFHAFFQELATHYAKEETGEGNLVANALAETKKYIQNNGATLAKTDQSNTELAQHVANDIIAPIIAEHRKLAQDFINANKKFTTEVWNAVDKGCDAYQFPKEVCFGILSGESEYIPTAASGTGAVGLFQHIESTWILLLRNMTTTQEGKKILGQYPELGKIANQALKANTDQDKKEVLKHRTTPLFSVLVGLYEAKDFQRALQHAGIPERPGLFFLRNILGSSNAVITLYKAAMDPTTQDTPVNQLYVEKEDPQTRVINDTSIQYNPLVFGILRQPKTSQEALKAADNATRLNLKGMIAWVGFQKESTFVENLKAYMQDQQVAPQPSFPKTRTTAPPQNG